MHSEGTVFEALPNRLHDVLQYLHQNPSPFVPSPPETKKRASVALILRVRPAYANWPSSGDFLGNASLNGVTHLKEFFEQDWVQSGDPEALFIKRTSRKGDRWGGQVALPGGGRDPEDEDDRATAIRETAEEVGLDLTAHAIAVGSLPQRVVTASWVRSLYLFPSLPLTLAGSRRAKYRSWSSAHTFSCSLTMTSRP